MSAALELRIATISDEARAATIANQEGLTAANRILLDIKRARNEIAETFEPIIEKAHQAHKEALAQRKKHEDPLAHAERFLKGLISAYVQAEEDKRRRAAEEVARAERERLEAEAEANRKASQALDEAAAAEAKGDPAGAERILNRATASIDETFKAIPAAPPPAPPKPVMAPGMSYREVWQFRIVDASLLPREYLVPDEVKIRRVVQIMKSGTKIPGVQVWPEKQIAARA